MKRKAQSIRLSPELMDLIIERSKENERSVNSEITFLLKQILFKK